jgi:hypothetical protein
MLRSISLFAVVALGLLSALTARAEAPVDGVWIGETACPGGRADVSISIKSNNGSSPQFMVHAKVRVEGMQAASEFDLVGDVDLSRPPAITLQPTRVTAKMPGFDIGALRLLLRRDQQHLFVQLPGGCRPQDLVRISTNNSAASAAPSAPQSPVAGDWEGRATCGRDPVDVVLLVRPSQQGSVNALLETYPPDTPIGLVTHTAMAGRQQDSASRYRFVPIQNGPQGTGIDADLSGTESAPQMTVSSQSCGSFVLTKATATAPSRRLSVQTGGTPTYRPDDAIENRCKALIQWAMRFSREYPNVDMMNTSVNDLEKKGLLLFADNDFIPVFGFAYDSAYAPAFTSANGEPTLSATPEANILQVAARDLNGGCTRDPFIRNEGQWIWNHPLFNPLGKGPFYYGGDFSMPAIRHYIEKVRAIRNNLSTASSGSDNSRSYSDRMSMLLAYQATLKGNSSILWPSEASSAMSRLTASINAAANAEGQRVFKSISAISDPKVGLREIKIALTANGPTYFFSNLDSAGKDRLTRQFEEQREAYSRAIAEPFLQRAKELATTFEDAKKVPAIINDANASFALLEEHDRQQYVAAIANRQNEIIGKFVADDLTALKAFPAGRAGLDQSAAWIKDFDARYADFSTLRPAIDGKDQFVKDRSARLAGALPEAKTALAAIDPNASNAQAEAKTILMGYFSWSGDPRLPESIEYDLLGAPFGVSVTQ